MEQMEKKQTDNVQEGKEKEEEKGRRGR